MERHFVTQSYFLRSLRQIKVQKAQYSRMEINYAAVVLPRFKVRYKHFQIYDILFCVHEPQINLLQLFFSHARTKRIENAIRVQPDSVFHFARFLPWRSQPLLPNSDKTNWAIIGSTGSFQPTQQEIIRSTESFIQIVEFIGCSECFTSFADNAEINLVDVRLNNVLPKWSLRFLTDTPKTRVVCGGSFEFFNGLYPLEGTERRKLSRLSECY